MKESSEQSEIRICSYSESFKLFVELLYFLQLSGNGIDDETTHGDVLRNQWMGLDGLHGLADGCWCVAETFQPMIEINAAFTYGVQCLILDTARLHHMVEMAITHVARSTLAVCDNHDFFYT